jgi:hypothetical protein
MVKISDHSDFNGMISKDLTNVMIQSKNDYAMIASSNIGGDKHYLKYAQNRLYSTNFLVNIKIRLGQHWRPWIPCKHGEKPNGGLGF